MISVHTGSKTAGLETRRLGWDLASGRLTGEATKRLIPNVLWKKVQSGHSETVPRYEERRTSIANLLYRPLLMGGCAAAPVT